MVSIRVQNPAVELLARVQTGDRVAAAGFLERFGDRIRCRAPSQMSNPVRRLFDSQDTHSTGARKLDEKVCSGRVQAANEGQFMALLIKMAGKVSWT